MPIDFDEELAMRAQTRDVYRELDQKEAEAVVRDFEFEETNLAQQLDEEYEPPPWRIADLHAVGSNTTIQAHAKTGKTTMMHNLIRSMCDGVPFLDHKVIVPEGNIAYFNMEVDKMMSLQTLNNAGVKNRERLFLQHLRGRYFPIYNPEMVKRMVDWLQRHTIEVLIIDPVGRLMRGWPGKQVNAENDSGVASELQHHLDAIKLASGVCDIFLPIHTGHNDAAGEDLRARGSIMWLDWPDHIWRLWSREIVHEQIRHFNAYGRGVWFETHLLSFDQATGRYGLEADSEAVLRRGRAQAVVEALVQLGGVSDAATLRKKLKGVGNGGAPEAYEAAEEFGWIVQDKEGNRVVRRLNKADEYVQSVIQKHGMEEL